MAISSIVRIKPLTKDLRTTLPLSIDIAKAQKVTVEFEFCGVTIRVNGRSNLFTIYRDYDRGCRGYLGKNPTIGPNPKGRLTALQMSKDALIEAKNEAMREERKARFQRGL